MLFCIIMENNNYKNFMLLAIEEAKIASQENEVPVGAVIVYKKQVIAKSGNLMIKYSNPLMHAEMIVLKKASEILSSNGLSIRHEKLDIYVTLEPCAMCAQAISLCRIANLYYGADDPKGGGVKYGSKVFDQITCHHRPNVISGIEKENSKIILQSFFKKLRSN
jgi:tRNA(adenine34) deaminase